jgi:hypothetical protein
MSQLHQERRKACPVRADADDDGGGAAGVHKVSRLKGPRSPRRQQGLSRKHVDRKVRRRPTLMT